MKFIFVAVNFGSRRGIEPASITLHSPRHSARAASGNDHGEQNATRTESSQ